MNTGSPIPDEADGYSSPRAVVIVSESTLAGTAGAYLVTGSIPAAIIAAVAAVVVVALMIGHHH